MKKFFLHDGKEQIGPFSLEELKQKQVSKDTNIWIEGMKDWDKAGSIEELKSLFVSTPPPFVKTPPPLNNNKTSSNTTATNTPTKKKSPLLWIIGGALVLVAIIIVVLVNSNSGGGYNGGSESGGLFSNPPERQKTPEELRQELLVHEQSSPKEYLTHEGTWRENLLGLTVLEGTIKNTATMANFKDIILEVTWLTKTETVIETARYAVIEYVQAGQTIQYKLKVEAPNKTGGVRIGIDSATPVN